MINEGGKKENANPTVHAVNATGKYSRILLRQHEHSCSFLGQKSIVEYSKAVVNNSASSTKCFFDDSNDVSGLAQSVDERSVYMALQDIVQSRKGYILEKNAREKVTEIDTTNLTSTSATPLPILQDAGFYIDPDLHFSLPVFRPVTSGGATTNGKSTHAITRDPFDEEEVFDMIRSINDPEHPLTLEQLNVVNLQDIKVADQLNIKQSTVQILFTPTIPHCSMATLIGLCIRVKLLRSLPSRFKVAVQIKPGTHASETAINKQLADKERVKAALENQHLLGVVNKCIG